MLPQYWRLYLLTLVLGVGGSFQYGLHISVITFPAEVVWEEPCDTQIRVSVNKKIWITELLTVFAAHSKICEPHVDAEVRGAAVWFQQPAHLVLHLGCVEPGGLAGGHSWWQTSCCLWAVRQQPEHTLTHTHMYIHSDKLLINSNCLMIILLACAVHICTKSVVLYCQTWVFLLFFFLGKKHFCLIMWWQLLLRYSWFSVAWPNHLRWFSWQDFSTDTISVCPNKDHWSSHFL